MIKGPVFKQGVLDPQSISLGRFLGGVKRMRGKEAMNSGLGVQEIINGKVLSHHKSQGGATKLAAGVECEGCYDKEEGTLKLMLDVSLTET